MRKQFYKNNKACVFNKFRHYPLLFNQKCYFNFFLVPQKNVIIDFQNIFKFNI